MPETQEYRIEAHDLESWERLFKISNLEEQMRLHQIVVYLLDNGKDIPLTFNNVDRIKSQIWANEKIGVSGDLRHLAKITNVHPLYLEAETFPSQIAMAGLKSNFELYLAKLVESGETIWNTLVTIKKGGPTSENLKTLADVLLSTLEPYKQQITQVRLAIVYDYLGPAHSALPITSRNFKEVMARNNIEVGFFTDREINKAQIWLAKE